MRKLYRATDFVLDNEPCKDLFEVNLVNQEDGRWHRYEVLIVVRDDKLAEYRRDMGLRDDFKDKRKPEGLHIMGGFFDPYTHERCIEETVASLRAIACEVREYPAFDRQELPELSKWQDEKKLKNKMIFS